jgi:hypothetical protein
MSHPKYPRPKEDFNSVGGSSINLGHFRNKSNSSADFKAAFTMHENVRAQEQLVLPPKGLSTTKFGPGFHRRHESHIKGLFADENQRIREEYQHSKQQRAEQMAQYRSQSLRHADYRAGYNIINNQDVNVGGIASTSTASLYTSSSVSLHNNNISSSSSSRNTNNTNNTNGLSMTGGIRMCGSGLGPEAPARGRSALREGTGRFHLPHASGHQHDYRQDVLCREGITDAKCVSILQLGKRDLPSFGIDDQFGKSEYVQHRSNATRQGLYEATLPGKYTPRKIEGHPAGNPAIVQQWTSSIDLNNRCAVAPSRSTTSLVLG